MQHPDVRVQTADFDLQLEQRELLVEHASAGAVVSFLGVVRGVSEGCRLEAMTLEHYPGMTEAVIQGVVNEARRRFELLAVRVVHRVGKLQAGGNIVGVVVVASHRGAAFQGCEFLMDHLKTQAPFWKKEHREDGDHWVAARPADADAQARWAMAKDSNS